MRRTHQEVLPFHKGSRGGWRPGAGRKPGPNPAVRHLSRESFPSRHPCHVTLKVRKGVPSLRNARVVHEVEDSFRRGCERAGFRINHYSLQDDHLHAIVEAKGPEALGRGMMSLAARFARAVNRALRRTGPVLADRYHLHVLRSPKEVWRALRYVLLNGRRHAAKARGGKELRGPARLDPASSARWFDGWRHGASGSDPRAGPGPPAVARPHTWLLSRGWRRWGLLDPADVPGWR
jgi:REP element-mobilizing transposase RayT